MKLAVALAGLITALPLATEAEPLQLRFAYAGMPNSHMYTQGIMPWVEKVMKEADETVDIKVFPGPTLGTLQVIYDRVQNAVVDLAFVTVGPVVTNFPRTTVASLPFEVPTGIDGSMALWRTYERGALADEFASVKPMAVMTFANISLHSRKPIKTLDDVRGMKFAAQSRMTAQVVDKLGGTPITMPVTDFYQALQRGTVDGADTGWPAVNAFKLIEVTSNHIEEPLGAEIAFHAMSKDAYAKLPDKARAAVDRNAGRVFSDMMGRAIDNDNTTGRAEGVTRGHTLVKLPADEVSRWKQRVQPLFDEWIAATPNGANVLAVFREEMAKVRSGK